MMHADGPYGRQCFNLFDLPVLRTGPPGLPDADNGKNSIGNSYEFSLPL
jgi:hypothetical protein